jgi:hypothetical protein
MSLSALESRTLWVTVWHSDMFVSVCETIWFVDEEVGKEFAGENHFLI